MLHSEDRVITMTDILVTIAFIIAMEDMSATMKDQNLIMISAAIQQLIIN